LPRRRADPRGRAPRARPAPSPPRPAWPTPRRAAPAAPGLPSAGGRQRGGAGSPRPRRSPDERSVFLLHPEQLRRLGAEALQVGILLVPFLHPLHGLGEPLAGLVFVAELPVGHGQEEAFAGV